MKKDDMRVIGQVMVDILNHPGDETVTAHCNARIAELCQKYPLYPDVE